MEILYFRIKKQGLTTKDLFLYTFKHFK